MPKQKLKVTAKTNKLHIETAEVSESPGRKKKDEAETNMGSDEPLIVRRIRKRILSTSKDDDIQVQETTEIAPTRMRRRQKQVKENKTTPKKPKNRVATKPKRGVEALEDTPLVDEIMRQASEKRLENQPVREKKLFLKSVSTDQQRNENENTVDRSEDILNVKGQTKAAEVSESPGSKKKDEAETNMGSDEPLIVRRIRKRILSTSEDDDIQVQETAEIAPTRMRGRQKQVKENKTTPKKPKNRVATKPKRGVKALEDTPLVDEIMKQASEKRLENQSVREKKLFLKSVSTDQQRNENENTVDRSEDMLNVKGQTETAEVSELPRSKKKDEAETNMGSDEPLIVRRIRKRKLSTSEDDDIQVQETAEIAPTRMRGRQKQVKENKTTPKKPKNRVATKPKRGVKALEDTPLVDEIMKQASEKRLENQSVREKKLFLKSVSTDQQRNENENTVDKSEDILNVKGQTETAEVSESQVSKKKDEAETTMESDDSFIVRRRRKRKLSTSKDDDIQVQETTEITPTRMRRRPKQVKENKTTPKKPKNRVATKPKRGLKALEDTPLVDEIMKQASEKRLENQSVREKKLFLKSVSTDQQRNENENTVDRSEDMLNVKGQTETAEVSELPRSKKKDEAETNMGSDEPLIVRRIRKRKLSTSEDDDIQVQETAEIAPTRMRGRQKLVKENKTTPKKPKNRVATKPKRGVKALEDTLLVDKKMRQASEKRLKNQPVREMELFLESVSTDQQRNENENTVDKSEDILNVKGQTETAEVSESQVSKKKDEAETTMESDDSFIVRRRRKRKLSTSKDDDIQVQETTEITPTRMRRRPKQVKENKTTPKKPKNRVATKPKRGLKALEDTPLVDERMRQAMEVFLESLSTDQQRNENENTSKELPPPEISIHIDEPSEDNEDQIKTIVIDDSPPMRPDGASNRVELVRNRYRHKFERAITMVHETLNVIHQNTTDLLEHTFAAMSERQRAMQDEIIAKCEEAHASLMAECRQHTAELITEDRRQKRLMMTYLIQELTESCHHE